MASKPNLLTIPLELRWQVYSYHFLHDSVVGVVRSLFEKPLRNGIVRACRQTHDEATEYYYANNTFLLALQRDSEATPKVPSSLGRVQHLQVEIGDLVFSPRDRAFLLDPYTQQRWDWFLKTLRQAKEGQQGKLLKTLVAVDRCGTSIVSESIPPTAQIWKDQKRREEKRREVLASVLRPLCHAVEEITIESRAMSRERDRRGRLTKTWNVVLSVGQVKPLPPTCSDASDVEGDLYAS